MRRFSAGAWGSLAILASLAVLLVVFAARSVADGSDAAGAELRAQLQAERAQHHRALSIRTRQVRELREARQRDRLVLLHDPEVDEALQLAAAVYGVPLGELREVVRCESHFNPRVTNREGSGAAGLAQFMPDTFAGTPPGRAGLSIFSPYANALAAGWLWSQSRWRAWACQP